MHGIPLREYDSTADRRATPLRNMCGKEAGDKGVHYKSLLPYYCSVMETRESFVMSEV